MLCIPVLTNRKAANANDATLAEALGSYHREKLTNNQTISERLKREHGITMRSVSPSKIHVATFFAEHED